MDAAELQEFVEALERREELLPVIYRSRNRLDARTRLTGEHGLSELVADQLLDARVGSLVEGAVEGLRNAWRQAEVSDP